MGFGVGLIVPQFIRWVLVGDSTGGVTATPEGTFGDDHR